MIIATPEKSIHNTRCDNSLGILPQMAYTWTIQRRVEQSRHQTLKFFILESYYTTVSSPG